MKKLAIALLLLASLGRTCSAQEKVVVGQLTSNDSNYTLTFLALDAAPTYVMSGEGYYDLSNAFTEGKFGYGYSQNHAKSITRVIFDASLKDAVTTSTRYWLYNLSNLKSENIITIENLNTSAVTQMDNMFFGCSSLTSLDVANFNTANVRSMDAMFFGCSSLTSLDVANFNTGNVTDMGRMFFGCSSLTSLDVTNFDTGNVTNMASMFYNCSSLTGLDMTNFDTGNITDMGYMFFNCRALKSLDVTNFDTSNVISMSAMFFGCSSLTSLDVTNFATNNVTNMANMFYGCSGLASLDVTNFNTGNVRDMRGMFQNCSGLTSLDVTNFNTGNVTNMSNMFYGCSGLASLDVTNFNTGNVTDMSGMFQNCSGLTNLDVTNFNTGNVTGMRGMFQNCSGLTNLDVTNFDTGNVTGMGYMFYNCRTLKSLDVTNFDTSNVISMSAMFFSCSSLTSLDVTNFDTRKDSTMVNMFYGCVGLTNIDISSFSMSDVSDITHMFYNCSGLKSINLGGNDLTQVDSNEGATYYVGTASSPCYLIRTFDRSSLGTVTINKDAQVPPYYQYCEGYFTIADTLDSEKDYVLAAAKSDADLWVKARTLKANVWNTLVIPAGTTQEQLKTAFGDDVQVCYIYSYANNKLTFKTLEGETRANMPVLVKPSTDIKNVAFANVELEQPGDLTWTTQDVDGTEHYASFIGSYKQSITIGNDCFYYYDGKFLRSAGGSIVNNTRGYFKFSDITAATPGGAKEFVLDDGTGNVTSIDAIDGELVSGHAPAYNLSGQRVGDDYRGIVIVQGKKYLRK